MFSVISENHWKYSKKSPSSRIFQRTNSLFFQPSFGGGLKQNIPSLSLSLVQVKNLKFLVMKAF